MRWDSILLKRGISLKILSFCLILSALCILSLDCYAVDVSSVKISLSIEDGSIEDLTKDVFEKTGYTLLFPEHFHSMKVRGNFSNVTLDQLLARVLKGVNHSLVINEEESFIIVHLFGRQPDQGEDEGVVVSADPSSPERYFAELVAIAKKNEEEFQKFRNNPNSIDPSSGLSFGELWKSAASGESEISKFINSENSIDPTSGVALDVVKENAKRNNDELDAFLADPSSIDPVSGRNIQELRQIAEQQQRELDLHPINIKF